MNTWSMNTWLLVIGGIGFAAIAYQIWSGRTFANKDVGSDSRSVSRNSEPAKYWLAIGVQLIILIGMILYFYFQV